MHIEFLICFLLALILVMRKSIFIIVPPHKAFVIERLGKFHKVCFQGVNLILPFIDRIKTKVDLQTRTIKFIAQPLITKDNQTTSLETILSINITDPVKATYNIESLERGLEYVTTAILRDIINEIELADVANSTAKITEKLAENLSEASDRWGCKIENVQVITLSQNGNAISEISQKNATIVSNDFNAIKEFK